MFDRVVLSHDLVQGVAVESSHEEHDHAWALPPLLGNNNLAGKLIVMGSLVLGLLKPIIFLTLFLRERSVKR